MQQGQYVIFNKIKRASSEFLSLRGGVQLRKHNFQKEKTEADNALIEALQSGNHEKGRTIYQFLQDKPFMKQLILKDLQYPEENINFVYEFCSKLESCIYRPGQSLQLPHDSKVIYHVISGHLEPGYGHKLKKQASQLLINSSRNEPMGSAEKSSQLFQTSTQLKFEKDSYFGNTAELVQDWRYLLCLSDCYLIRVLNDDVLQLKKQFRKAVQEKQSLFARVIPRFYESLSRAKITQFLESSQFERFFKLSAIYKEGQESEKLFILRQGEVTLAKKTHKNGIVKVEQVVAGEMLGDELLFEPCFQFTATAQVDCELYEIRLADLRSYLPLESFESLTQLARAKSSRRQSSLKKNLEIRKSLNSKKYVNQLRALLYLDQSPTAAGITSQNSLSPKSPTSSHLRLKMDSSHQKSQQSGLFRVNKNEVCQKQVDNLSRNSKYLISPNFTSRPSINYMAKPDLIVHLRKTIKIRKKQYEEEKSKREFEINQILKVRCNTEL